MLADLLKVGALLVFAVILAVLWIEHTDPSVEDEDEEDFDNHRQGGPGFYDF